ncbi:hypothetical protein [Actibacterium sp. D379-3]
MRRSLILASLSDVTVTEPLVLVVGMDPGELPRGRNIGSGTRLEALPFTLIHAALATAPWAEEVVTPLVSEHFDAMDMAMQLSLAGYTGTYTVMIPPLPRPDIIRRELCQICPGLKVELRQRAPH